MSANVSKTVKHSDEWKHSQHVPKQVSALLKLRELGVFLRLRMCFTFMVPLCPADKAERGTTKQVLIFSYSGINNGKRTCCSLEVAFPELQNLYVQKKRNF